jgi:hypothetical protein
MEVSSIRFVPVLSLSVVDCGALVAEGLEAHEESSYA